MVTIQKVLPNGMVYLSNGQTVPYEQYMRMVGVGGNAPVTSPPMSPTPPKELPLDPTSIIESIGVNRGSRGSYTGPATPNTPIDTGFGFGSLDATQPFKRRGEHPLYGANPESKNTTSASIGNLGPALSGDDYPSSAMVDAPPPATGEPSFMDRLLSKRGIGAIGAGLLSMSQDPALQKLGASQLDKMQTTSDTNKTIQMLRAKGEDKLADFIEANPTMAKTALTQYLQKEYAAKASMKTSAPIVDPVTGQVYVVATDPTTGQVYRQNIEGAVGETPSAKAIRESEQRVTEGDKEAGYQMGYEYFTQAENIRGQIANFDDALTAIDNGIKNNETTSGFFRQYLPSINASTSALRQAANRMGITVINSATFGALSAEELRLALSTEMDLSLPPSELRKEVVKRRAAKEKFALELEKKAREAQNLGRKAFIDKYTELQKNNPESIKGTGGSNAIYEVNF